MRAFVFAMLVATGTGCVRAPAPLDVPALVARRGPVEAHRDLTIRVLEHPRDVQARLALAALADGLGRPSEAIEQLEAVERLGGPLGVRWHDDDRTRLARLLLARARLRIARGAPSGLVDLERARSLGAKPTADEVTAARVVDAVAHLRHVDTSVRAGGRAVLAELASTRPEWLGARPGASAVERGTFGAWSWTVGARREAWEQLAVWHAATPMPRDERLQGAYLRAFAWWTPLWLGELPPPPDEDLVGPERCWFPGTHCTPPASDPPRLPPVTGIAAAPADVAIARYAATRGFDAGFTRAALDDSRAQEASEVSTRALLRVVQGHRREPAIGERIARDVVAASTDAAAAHATLGALYDALGDTARARGHWQQAASLSDEVPFVRGLAIAAARAGDGPAALVFATTAAAAAGDPAPVWDDTASALIESKQLPEALSASRQALDLAGPEELPRALDLAVTASRALGRDAQAQMLTLQRAQVAPQNRAPDADSIGALAAHRERPTADTVARLWVASRAHPRDVELRVALVDALDADDPRHATVTAELLELTGDADAEAARAAVRSLAR